MLSEALVHNKQQIFKLMKHILQAIFSLFLPLPWWIASHASFSHDYFYCLYRCNCLRNHSDICRVLTSDGYSFDELPKLFVPRNLFRSLDTETSSRYLECGHTWCACAVFAPSTHIGCKVSFHHDLSWLGFQSMLIYKPFVADITEDCKWPNCVIFLDVFPNIGSFNTTFVTNYLHFGRGIDDSWLTYLPVFANSQFWHGLMTVLALCQTRSF